MNASQIGFAIAGVICFALFPFARALYDFDLRLYRKWMGHNLARKWEDRESWALPLLRVILGIGGIIFLIFAYLRG